MFEERYKIGLFDKNQWSFASSPPHSCTTTMCLILLLLKVLQSYPRFWLMRLEAASSIYISFCRLVGGFCLCISFLTIKSVKGDKICEDSRERAFEKFIFSSSVESPSSVINSLGESWWQIVSSFFCLPLSHLVPMWLFSGKISAQLRVDTPSSELVGSIRNSIFS